MNPPLLLLLLLLLPFPPTTADLAGDAAALLSFRSSLSPRLPWNASLPPCTWPGVSCSASRVVSLRLPASGLTGPIPAGTLANLSRLHTLSLRFNALSGPLPPDLAQCRRLRNLYLQSNRLSGPLPPFLPRLRSLVRLNLADNNLSGAIPIDLTRLPRLRTLYLESNRLAGELPGLDLPDLDQFNVSFNRLAGPIPPQLRRHPATAFLGMPLCGAPLPPCPVDTSPSPSPAASPYGKRRYLSGGAIAGIVIGGIALFLILATILLLRRKKRKGGDELGEAKRPEAEVALRGEGAAVMPRKGMVFFGNVARGYELEDLLRASAEVLGKGTFGTTYKAVLESGLVVAVKRLRDGDGEEGEFRERIEGVGGIRHANVVALQGYYVSRDEKLLVYDYVGMGSLSSLLHG